MACHCLVHFKSLLILLPLQPSLVVERFNRLRHLPNRRKVLSARMRASSVEISHKLHHKQCRCCLPKMRNLCRHSCLSVPTKRSQRQFRLADFTGRATASAPHALAVLTNSSLNFVWRTSTMYFGDLSRFLWPRRNRFVSSDTQAEFGCFVAAVTCASRVFTHKRTTISIWRGRSNLMVHTANMFSQKFGEPIGFVDVYTLTDGESRKARCHRDIGLFSWIHPTTQHGLVAETV